MTTSTAKQAEWADVCNDENAAPRTALPAATSSTASAAKQQPQPSQRGHVVKKQKTSSTASRPTLSAASASGTSAAPSRIPPRTKTAAAKTTKGRPAPSKPAASEQASSAALTKKRPFGDSSNLTNSSPIRGSAKQVHPKEPATGGGRHRIYRGLHFPDFVAPAMSTSQPRFIAFGAAASAAAVPWVGLGSLDLSNLGTAAAKSIAPRPWMPPSSSSASSTSSSSSSSSIESGVVFGQSLRSTLPSMSQSLTQPSQPEVHAEALTATQTSISSATTGTDDAALVKDTVPTKEPADGHQAKDTTETSAPIYSLAVPLSTLRENRETPAGDTIHIPTGDPDVRVSSGAAGRYHALVLASNGKVWSVGRVHPTGIMRCMSSTADDKDDDGDGDGDRDGDTEWMRDVRAVALDGKDIVQVACTDHASLLLDRQGRVYMVGCLKDGDGRSFYAKSKELDSVLVRLPMPPKTPADTAITQLSTSSNRIWMVTKQGDVLSYGFGSLWGGTTTSVEAARSRKTPSGIPAARHIVFDTHCEPTGSEAKTGKDAASHGDGDGDGHGHGHSDDTAGQPRRRRKAHMTAITASDTRLELTDATGALWAVGALDPDTEIGAETGTAVTADKPIKLSMAGSAADQGASPTVSSANDDPQPRAAGHAGLCARGTTDQRSFG